MPCILLVLILAFPRAALVLMFFLSQYLQRAYHNMLVLLLGFLFLPITTIVYAWMINSNMPTAGVNLLWLLLAVVIDLGSLGGGYSKRRA